MDAVAKDMSDNSPVVLYNGKPEEDTNLKARLARAAAKVVININASDNVVFRNYGFEDGSEGGLFYVRNLPYDTWLLAETQAASDLRNVSLRTTAKTDTEYFTWNPDYAAGDKNVTLTTYVYPHNWTGESILDKETCAVINLPLDFKVSDTETVSYPNSWYKIPMTDNSTFERNNIYQINITLDRPGASEEAEPITLDEIYYTVEDWTEVTVSVGNNDRPKYLSVNETSMSMHNVAKDSTTLEFASSSPVTIDVKDVYYYNKFGQVTPVASSDIYGTTIDGSIAGNITVHSPVPENNAIRYFTLVVTNQEGMTREVFVSQYPLEYITNQQGWYSYRSDFYTGNYAPTTYENRGSRRSAVDWDNNSWSYETGESGQGHFFGSKVASMRNDGTSTLYYYYWERNNSSDPTPGIGNLGSLNNARMYHVQITSSSPKYIVGIPMLDASGFTDDGADNAKLVSPSFMIASQLGATQPPTSVEQAERHCREYVEVHDPDNDPDTDNAIHYDNWRLPTAAEIQIIIDFQYVENAAMDEVLSGPYYWSATGQVNNPGSGDDGTQSAVRCIRDVY